MSFRHDFGNFASPQNPFFTGRVAMVLQGPWIYNFIRNYAPGDFEWGLVLFFFTQRSFVEGIATTGGKN